MNIWVRPLVLRASAWAAPCAWVAQHEGQEAEGGGRRPAGRAGKQGSSGCALRGPSSTFRPRAAGLRRPSCSHRGKKKEGNWEVLLREIRFSCQLSSRWITLSGIAQAEMKSNIFATKTMVCIFSNCIRWGLLFKIRCYGRCRNILHYSSQASIPLVSLSFAVRDANTGLCSLE